MYNNLPSFLSIGAQKCGTTWISNMIQQHPNVCRITKKEIHYFDKVSNLSKGMKWYISHFKPTKDTIAIGEFTPNYFWACYNCYEKEENDLPDNIPELIYKMNPEIRLILTLRNPVDRAISAFYHHIRSRRISPGKKFSDLIHHFGILSMGYYDLHLSAWLKYFPLNQFLVLIYERDVADSKKISTIEKMFEHIGIDKTYRPKGIFNIYNNHSSGYELRLRSVFAKMGKGINYITPKKIKNSKLWDIKIDKEEYAMLNQIYTPHNQKLSEILNQQLPW